MVRFRVHEHCGIWSDKVVTWILFSLFKFVGSLTDADTGVDTEVDTELDTADVNTADVNTADVNTADVNRADVDADTDARHTQHKL